MTSTEYITEAAAASAGIRTEKRNFACIDMSDFDNRMDEITEALMQAAKTDGFFYGKPVFFHLMTAVTEEDVKTLIGMMSGLLVVNHGISIEDIRAMFEESVRFFALDDEIKAKYPLDVSRNAGWEKLAQIRPSTGVADLKESIQFGFHGIDDLWPSDEDVPGFRSRAERFMHLCNEVSHKILTCLAIGLGFHKDFFTRCHDISQPDCLNTLRCLHYTDITGQTFPPEYWRAGAHTDFDTLTLLFQRPGEDGLEVCPGREVSTEFAHGDVWAPVSPKEGEIVCNLGDMIMRWSDDVLKSNFHRVRAPKPGEYQGPRYSIAYFNQSNKSAIIQGRTRYPEPITAGEFLRQALERNYKALQELKAKKAAEAAAASTITVA